MPGPLVIRGIVRIINVAKSGNLYVGSAHVNPTNFLQGLLTDRVGDKLHLLDTGLEVMRKGQGPFVDLEVFVVFPCIQRHLGGRFK